MNTPAPHPMPAGPGRPVIVILGAGRSGTSLLMQILGAMGMGLSADMIEARRDNPRGFFEDAAIVKIQADLLRALGAWPYHPLPADWLARPQTAAAGRQLRAVLRERLARPGIWGFKDPRTASFLPMWQALFAAVGLDPKYILALRAPGKVIGSFMRAYGTPGDVAEAVWLRRTCDALWHTRANCHVVHYEDWFSRPAEVAKGLARFTGLAEPGEDALRTIVRPDLNRSGTAPYTLGNAPARTLHALLERCRGDASTRQDLLAAVAACQSQ